SALAFRDGPAMDTCLPEAVTLNDLGPATLRVRCSQVRWASPPPQTSRQSLPSSVTTRTLQQPGSERAGCARAHPVSGGGGTGAGAPSRAGGGSGSGAGAAV